MSERRPEPVVSAAQLSAFATWITGLAVTWLAHRGWLLPAALAEPVADAIEVALVAVVGTAGTLWASYWARRRVTPVADPRDADGTPLVRSWRTDTVELPVIRPGRHHPMADV